MSDPVSIDHTTRYIEAGIIQARQAYALRRVPIFLSTLCRVRHGEKLIEWGQRTMRAGPQQLILIPAGQELGIANLPGINGYLADAVTFSPEVLHNFRSRHGKEMMARSMQPSASATLCVPLDRHTEEAWNHLLACLASDASPVLQTHYAESVLLALCLAGHAGPLLTDRRDPLGARVQQLLMLDPAMDWTVSMVAEHLHVGASTLRRQLAAEERSFRDILSGVRLGMALQWLQNTKRPIGEIAEASGYASASRFSVRFRAHYGLSPRDLRAAM